MSKFQIRFTIIIISIYALICYLTKDHVPDTITNKNNYEKDYSTKYDIYIDNVLQQ